MRNYILFFLSALYGVLLYSQEITSDLSVHISPYSKEDVFAFEDTVKVNYVDFNIFPVCVTQTIHLKEGFRDTLELEMKHPSFMNASLQGLFFNDLSVIAKLNKSSSNVQLKYAFNGGKLIVYPPYLSSELEINYRYQSDFPIKMQNNVLYYLQPVMSDWHSWYFTQSKMKISQITISYPEDEALLFVNFPMNVDSSVCHFDFKDHLVESDDQDISFYLLNKRFYRHESISGPNFDLNLFISQKIKTDTVCVSLKGERKQRVSLKGSDHFKSFQIDSLKNKLKESMKEIISFFGCDNPITFNIVDADLGTFDEKGERTRWGRVVKSSNRDYFILQDTSFWSRHDCIHELIHPFILYSSNVSDQAHYFLEESMVDYLAVCFYTTEEQKRDSIFNEMMTDFNRINPSIKSIFNLKSDFISLDGESDGTSYVIYKKTPYEIHQFAKSIGEELFLSAVKDYYKIVNQKSSSTFELFEKVMKKHGISDKQWNCFVNLL